MFWEVESKRMHPLRLIFFLRQPVSQRLEESVSMNHGGAILFPCIGCIVFNLRTKNALQVYLPGVSVGSHRVECYAEYIRDGETRKTNVIFTQILAGIHV